MSDPSYTPRPDDDPQIRQMIDEANEILRNANPHLQKFYPPFRDGWHGTLVPCFKIHSKIIDVMRHGTKVSCHTNRHAPNSVIFDALCLTSGEREAVCEAVIDLVTKRLKKTQSFRL